MLHRSLGEDEGPVRTCCGVHLTFANITRASMKDLTIILDNRPGALAEMGEALGRAGVSIEGGGAWVAGSDGVAHFLFERGAAAREALEAVGIRVLAERETLAQRLKQDVPGQLGLLTRRMAEAGVNIEVLYSDHNHQLILVVDDPARGREVSEAWARESDISVFQSSSSPAPLQQVSLAVLKQFENPDETRMFEKGRFDIVKIGGMTIGRASYEPGWKWSEHVAPVAGATLCAVEHVGMVISGH